MGGLNTNGAMVSYTLRRSDKSSPVDGEIATVGEGKMQTLVLH
jgi:hypothetical protein